MTKVMTCPVRYLPVSDVPDPEGHADLAPDEWGLCSGVGLDRQQRGLQLPTGGQGAT